MRKSNIFENIKIDKKNEIFETLFKNSNVKIERIISNSQTSAPNFWYDQKEVEFVLLLEGSAIIEFENQNFLELKKGDYCIIKAHQKHRVAFTDKNNPTIWLAIFIQE